MDLVVWDSLGENTEVTGIRLPVSGVDVSPVFPRVGSVEVVIVISFDVITVVDVSSVVPGVESVDIVIVGTCDVIKNVFLTLEWEMRSCYVAQVGLELQGSRNPPSSASQDSGIRGMSHHFQPILEEL
ncbi:hypothetical protein AAY473_037822 [Plecturocebus cupreus]